MSQSVRRSGVRHILCATPLATAFRSSSTAAPTNNSPAVADVASELFSMMQYHRKEFTKDETVVCKKVEKKAWRAIQGLSEDQIDSAPAKELSELLDCWWYFGRHWEKGMDGPTSSDAADEADTLLIIPSASREDSEARARVYAQQDAMAPARRANPLDDVLDF